jgi:hypothetical protein
MVGCVARDGNVMKVMIIVDHLTMEDDLTLFGDDPRKVLIT